MATLAAIVGFRLPEDAAEDSYDLSAAILGRKSVSPLREATVHHGSRGWFGIRQGDWVPVDHPTGASNSTGANPEPPWFRRQRLVESDGHPVELFNLRQEPPQSRNLAAREPQRVRGMQRLLERYKRDGRSVRR